MEEGINPPSIHMVFIKTIVHVHDVDIVEQIADF